MTVLVHPFSRIDAWRSEFEAAVGSAEDLRWWPDIGDPAEIEYAVAWLLPRAAVAEMTNLRAILSLGAGAEQWLKPGMPEVPVVRLADPAMADEMAAYALSYVVRHQRRLAEAEANRAERSWRKPESEQTWSYSIGVLGFGEIGARIGRAFADFGYPVNAWTRSPRDMDGVTHYAGLDQLDDFLGASRAIINVLPSTEATTGLLTRERLGSASEGALFVNVGRGTVLADDQTLVDALDHGPLSAAVLDVTNPEPLPDDSPLWDHPEVTITPHISGITQIRSAARLISANLAKLRAGEPVGPLVDRSRGY